MSWGYAEVRILSEIGKVMHCSLVDFYSKVPDKGCRFLSKKMPMDNYVLEVKVTGEPPVWFDKDGTRFGSDNCYVSVEKTVLLK